MIEELDSLDALAEAIRVEVSCQYLEQQSLPAKPRHAFAYTITIYNHSVETVQLTHRHWIITDENHQVREVRGAGVVGQQPFIAPGHSYTYSSGAMIESRAGTMAGTYTMQTPNGTDFTVTIPTFTLIPPSSLH